MIAGKKLVVVMPAYNAERTLGKTFAGLPHDIIDEVLLTDDSSHDGTVALANELGIQVRIHPTNRGYGANQKTCYQAALDLGADIIVMIHPDYQYDPRLVRSMSSLLAEGVHDVVIGSRILGGEAVKGGMPRYKYIANRFLTAVQNAITGAKLSEYHTGYRAFSRAVLETLPILENSDDFIFDNQMLIQTIYFGLNICEITCPAHYDEESSSINLTRSVWYGLGVLSVGLLYGLSKLHLVRASIFDLNGKKLTAREPSGGLMSAMSGTRRAVEACDDPVIR